MRSHSWNAPRLTILVGTVTVMALLLVAGLLAVAAPATPPSGVVRGPILAEGSFADDIALRLPGRLGVDRGLPRANG